MKKLLLALALALALSLLAALQTASAHEGFRHGGCCYRGGGIGWVAPLAIGGVIGYELTRPSTVYVEPQPVVIQQSQPVVQAPPVGYHWQQMVDPQTGITKIVAVPNQ